MNKVDILPLEEQGYYDRAMKPKRSEKPHKSSSKEKKPKQKIYS